jgi:hypothetical protein
MIIQQGSSPSSSPCLKGWHLHCPGPEKRQKSEENQQTDEYFFDRFDGAGFLSVQISKQS